jgi:hypothetical protein
VGSAGADNRAATTTTLGSTTGTPSPNLCVATFDCTYVPYTGVSNPGLQVPFDGTGRPGTNRLAFNGRLNGKQLKPGRYTVMITATNSAGASTPVSLNFSITG